MKGRNYLMDSKVAHISNLYAEKTGLSVNEALQMFLGSTTYSALIDEDTGVCLESIESIYDMFLRELRGEKWE